VLVNLLFQKSTYQECGELFQEYLKNLSSVYDNYLEDYILDSVFYRIIYEQACIGYFAIHP
jgi:hypothetical protein